MSSSVSPMPARRPRRPPPGPSRSDRRTGRRPAGDAGSGTPRPRCNRRTAAPGSAAKANSRKRSGSSRAASPYIRSRQVQKVPPTAVGPPAQPAVEDVRVRVGEPGHHQAGAAARHRVRGQSRRRADPRSIDARRRRRCRHRTDVAVDQAARAAVRGHADGAGIERSLATRFSSTSARAPMPASAIRGVGVLLRGVRHPGRVAHEQHRRRHVRGEHAGVVPGPGRDHRRGTAVRTAAAPRPGSKATRSVIDSRCTITVQPSRRPPRRTAATIASTIAAVTVARCRAGRPARVPRATR